MAEVQLAVAGLIALLSLTAGAGSHRAPSLGWARHRTSLAPVGASMAALVLTVPSAASAQGNPCPNAAIRVAQGSTHLPDCRAFEKVTPEDKNGGNPYIKQGITQASRDGERVAFVVPASFGDGESAPRVSNYLGSRSDGGWATENIMQPTALDLLGGFLEVRTGYQWFDQDLSAGFFLRNDGPGAARNLYRRDLDARATSRITPDPVAPLDPFLQLYSDYPVVDASADGSRVLFESWQQLTPDAPAPTGVPHLYESSDGEVEFAGVLPDGNAAPMSVGGRGASVGGVFKENVGIRAMSDDGARFFFTQPDTATTVDYSQGLGGEVYLREGGETIHVSRSQRTDCADDPTCGGDGEPDPVVDPHGPGKVFFETATRDGAFVFLTSCRKLADDTGYTSCSSNTEAEALYRYEVESGELRTIVSAPANRTSPRVMGLSDDGETVYFGVDGSAGTDTYAWHSGESEFIGSIYSSWSAFSNYSRATIDQRGAHVSPDGRYLVFTARESFAGADIAGPGAGALYLYDRDAPTDKVACVSCPADGGPVASSASFGGGTAGEIAFMQHHVRPMDAARRWVIFNTQDALVSSDTNGTSDVYRYDIATGEHELMSGGVRGGAYLGDMSEDGSTVFIVTDQRLVGSDRDSQRDVYAVRSNGGFAGADGQREKSCEGDACQGAVDASPTPSRPASAGLRGRGDRRSAPRSATVRIGRMGLAQLSRLAAGRSARIAVRVSRPGRLRLTVRARVGGRLRVVAAVGVRARASGAVRVGIRLSRAARVQLARTGSLRLHVSARLADGRADRTLALSRGAAR